MQEQFEGQVQVIGVAGRDDLGEMEAFVNGFALDFPNIADEDIEIWRRYEVRSQPAFVFINDDGSFETIIGGMGESGLSSMIDELLAA